MKICVRSSISELNLSKVLLTTKINDCITVLSFSELCCNPLNKNFVFCTSLAIFKNLLRELLTVACDMCLSWTWLQNPWSSCLSLKRTDSWA